MHTYIKVALLKAVTTVFVRLEFADRRHQETIREIEVKCGEPRLKSVEFSLGANSEPVRLRPTGIRIKRIHSVIRQ